MNWGAFFSYLAMGLVMCTVILILVAMGGGVPAILPMMTGAGACISGALAGGLSE